MASLEKMVLTRGDLSHAIAALIAVSPSGGGSYLYTVAQKIAAQSGIDLAEIDPEYVVGLQRTAAAEIENFTFDA